MEEIGSGQTAYVPFLRDASVDKSSNPSMRTMPLRVRFMRCSALLGAVAVISTVCSILFICGRWTAYPELRRLLQNSATSLRTSHGSEEPLLQSRPIDIALWTNEDFMMEFESFAVSNRKSYSGESERKRRMRIFQKNLMYIHVHNAQNYTFSLAMNGFGDLTFDEFRSHYVSMHMKDKHRKGLLKSGINRAIDWSLPKVDPASLPPQLDWREKGCVTPVKNQERCGSCWAFSTTGAVEGAFCAQKGTLPSLSEQQLVDCAQPEGNLGCDGGEADWGFQYVIDNRGLCAEADYPYAGHEVGFCAGAECKSLVDIEGFRDVPPMNELATRAAITKYGPVSVAIEADQAAFQFYSSGVFTAACGTELDHAVLLVGYGTDHHSGKDYFIMKNSWGIGWGENGYMRMRRRPNSLEHAGECGVLLSPSYAVA